MIQKEKVLQRIKKRDAMSEISEGKLVSPMQRFQEYEEGRSIEAEMERITKTLCKSLEQGGNVSDENEELVDDTNIHFASTNFIEQQSEDEDSQDGEPTAIQQQMMNGFFMNTEFNSPLSSPVTIRETPDICRTDQLRSQILSGTNWRSNVLKKSVEEFGRAPTYVTPSEATNYARTVPMPRLSLLDTNSLIPKDAYFHELPNNAARNRNPLPMDVNENDILRGDLPTFSPSLYSNVVQMPPPRRPPIPLKPPHLAQPLQLPVHQHQHQAAMRSEAIENGHHYQHQHDRDSQNDSGYSGKLYSHNASPISTRLSESSPNPMSSTPSQDTLCNNNSKERCYVSKVGSSSLV